MKNNFIDDLQKNASLDDREARVYLALLEMGEVLIGPLAEELKLHKQSLYNTLRQLEEKKFVICEMKSGRQHFRAVNPEQFVQIKEQQLTGLERLVPQLQLLEGSRKHVADIQVYSGATAFQRFHEQQLKRMPKNSALDVLGAGGNDFLAVINQQHFFRRYENIRIDRKLQHRLLMYADQKDVDSTYINRKYVEARFLPHTLGQSPMATQIWPDSVSLLLFGADPQVIHIRSQKIREGFVAYFRTLWEIAQ